MRFLQISGGGSLAVGAMLVLSACASSAPRPTLETPPARPEPQFSTDGPGCAAARETARRSPGTRDLYPPAPTTLFIPRSSTAPLNGATLIMTVSVDTAGRAVPSSGRVVRSDNGVLVAGYKDEIAEALEKLTFRPAVLSGCAVEGTATILYRTRR